MFRIGDFAVALLFCSQLLGSIVFAGEIEIVAKTGDASPDGNGTLSVFGSPSIGNSGQVAFLGLTTGSTSGSADNVAIYRGDSTALTTIARKGISLLDGELLTNFVTTTTSVSSGGVVSGSGVLTGPPEEFVGFIGSGGALTSFPRLGDPSPSGNNEFVTGSFPVLNDAGDAAYYALYSGANSEVGIYSRAKNGVVSTHLLSGATAPNGGTINPISRLTLNESSQIGLWVEIEIDEEEPTIGGVLRLDGTTIVEMARDGDIAADTVTIVEEIDPRTLPINDLGYMAFSAKYSQPSVFADGIFLASGSEVTLVADRFLPGGTSAPDLFTVSGLNNNGQVAFWTEFLVGIDPLSGVYLADLSGETLVALEDSLTPEGNKYFRGFFNNSVSLNEKGQVVFVAELSDTANGPLSGRGIFLFDPIDGLQQIARTGDPLLGSTLSGLTYVGPGFGSTLSADETFSGLNDSGQVAFTYALANGQSGIAVWVPSTLPGDYNDDGKVSAADYTVWRDNLGANITLDNEDASPGVVDEEDYDVWLDHYGETNLGSGAGSAASLAAVPEPSAILIAAIVAGLLVARRRVS